MKKKVLLFLLKLQMEQPQSTLPEKYCGYSMQLPMKQSKNGSCSTGWDVMLCGKRSIRKR